MKKRNTVGFAITLAIIFLILWGICNFSSLLSVFDALMAVLTPITVGLCIAFVLNIPLRLLERLWIKLFSAKRRGLRRAVCIVLCLLLIAGIVALLVGLILPQIVSTVRNGLIPKIPSYIEKLRGWYAILTSWLAGFSITLPSLNISSEGVMSALTKLISNHGSTIIGESVTIATTAVGVIIDTICAAVISIYVLAQKETLGRYSRKILYGIFSEKNADRALTMARLTEKTFSKFIMGQLTEAVILGTLCFIGMLIFRIPYALIISVLMGITALVPIFGAFVGTAVGAVLILFESPIKAIGFIVFILILQQIEGNLIYPKVVGSQVGLPGLFVLIAVTIGSEFGIAGMLIAVPIASLIYTVTRQFINARIRDKGLEGIFEEDIPPKKPKKEKKKRKKGKEADCLEALEDDGKQNAAGSEN